ncbi:AAC(3) family N-acetyltransferase [Candidatus Thioglobus sp.]|nr:AAC(3) family N-acetyltransferase [Candidatus Thioglobus sp.]
MIRTTQKQLIQLFHSLGLKKGDTVVAHSALFSLGIIEGGIGGFFKSLQEIIGADGTLIVPTFTYSFRRNEVFDIANSPSAKNIGVFSEYIRNLPGSIRSSDPLFSFCAIGRRASELMKRDNKACFGLDSLYDSLFNTNATFLAIGINYSSGLSGFMHLEKLAKVPYRKDKEFFGIARNLEGLEFSDSAIHFARDDENYNLVTTNREPMGSILEVSGASIAVDYGYGRHLCLKGLHWRDVVLSHLAKDPLFMLDNTCHRTKV